MPLTVRELEAVTQFERPAVILQSKDRFCRWSCVAHHSVDVGCAARAVFTRSGAVIQAELNCGPDAILLFVGRPGVLPADASFVLQVEEWNVTGDCLRCVQPKWIRHPAFNAEPTSWATRALASWNDERSFTFSRGLRDPQIGALHSLAAHWTVDDSPALVVMPTGTGKTEVMLAALILRRPRRLLVLVPSDPLRLQIAEKFQSLGILPQIGALAPEVARPAVMVLDHAPATLADLAHLNGTNVVVTTSQMFARMAPELQRELVGQCDAVFFDEAHHEPASSWKALFEIAKGRVIVEFTATPFREDGQRMTGRIIYQYPLRLAQAKGYFTPITFLEVDEEDDEAADAVIARKAVEKLRADLAAGWDHILLARARTKDRAEALFTNHYKDIAGDLDPVVIHSGVLRRKSVLQAIRDRKHRVVICVDMFGEGFDLPALKIAAMHDVYKSLAITLQFTGRFTRSGAEQERATLIANVANAQVQSAISELYAEDSDWNEIIPELSKSAIARQLGIQAFLDDMEPGESTGREFDLANVRPATSTVIYRTSVFRPQRFKAALGSDTKVSAVWISKERTTCVFITRSRGKIKWAQVRDPVDEIWDLTILHFNRNLLFINSSVGTGHRQLARAVGGADAEPIRGEQMFRAFSGVMRLVFQNAGLYGRGKTRFKMFTGYDVGDAISPAEQANSTKSNLFGVGIEDGRKVTVGASAKGTVWSMSSSPIPDWTEWCHGVAAKITNDDIPANSYLQHTLIPREISALPERMVMSVSLPDAWLFDLDGRIQISAGAETVNRTSVSVEGWERQGRDILRVRIGVDDTVTTYSMSWSDRGLSVERVEGPALSVSHGAHQGWMEDYLKDEPLVVLFADGSEVQATRHLEARAAFPVLFNANQIQTLNWDGIRIEVESRWRNGVERPNSVQAQLLRELALRENLIVYDDDDTGETADVVEIAVQGHDVLIRLYHCKYSGARTPGVRVGDLYEVVGQAVRSSRLVLNPEIVLRNLEHRQSPTRRRGRPTRFEKGTLKQLRALRVHENQYQFRFEIAIVQPGLLANDLTPEAAAVLGSADLYVRQFTGRPLLVYASRIPE